MMNQLLSMLLLYSIIRCNPSNSIEDFDFDPPNPDNCTCVPYFQCSEETGKIITDGTGLFDVRYYTPTKQLTKPISCNHTFRDFNKNSRCTGYFDVCCDSSDVQTSSDRDEQFPFTSNVPDNPPMSQSRGCGYQYRGSFPWTGALLYRDQSLGQMQYKCGVSLIHPRVVLTAAHCLNVEQETIIGMTASWTIQIGHISRDSEEVILHPEYSDRSLHNDIALIILSEAVQLSTKVNPICISSIDVRLDGTKCTVSVWTKDSTYLKMVNIPIVGKEMCLKQLRQTRLGGYFQLHRSFICAGGENFKDTCGGDGGSPLVCPVANQPGRYQQAGIVSWGIGCGDHNVPGVYVYLPLFRNWIDQVLLKKGLKITEYRY